MKNLFKIMGVIAVLAVIGFSIMVVGCDLGVDILSNTTWMLESNDPQAWGYLEFHEYGEAVMGSKGYYIEYSYTVSGNGITLKYNGTVIYTGVISGDIITLTHWNGTTNTYRKTNN